MKTTVVAFPFDLFGSGGTAAGANLLADELREVLADNRRETVPTRARAYTERVRLREAHFETIEQCNGFRRQGRQLARQCLHQDDFLLWLAGNHLGVLPVYDELSGRGESVLVVQFDAHLDVHHFRDCTSEMSHGNFLLHVDGPLTPLVNLGHRDLLLPGEYIARFFRATYSAADLAVDDGRAIAHVRQLADRAERVYVDLDCDVLDPASFPAVSQPVPFGLTPPSLLRLLDAIPAQRLGGLFISEFLPARDTDDRSLALLVWLIEFVLLRRYEDPACRRPDAPLS
jgi:arginase family enzyme